VKDMKENKKTIQVLAIVTLLIAVVCISVGFALLSQNLTIEGSAKIIPAKWSVHFVVDDGATPTPNPVTYTFTPTGGACEGHDTSCYDLPTGETAPTPPTLTRDEFKTYSCILTKPGDACTYTFDVINDGDIDATISSVNPTSFSALTFTGTGATAAADVAKVENDVTYTVTWDDGTAIAAGQDLDAGDPAKTIKVAISYNSRTGQELPTAPVTITGRNLTITYQQKN
jgi:hypothetical protein